VNLVFVASIAVMHFYFWPVALVLSFLYPAVLFVWIRRFERSQPSPAPPVATPTDLQLVVEGQGAEAAGEKNNPVENNPGEGNSNNASDEQNEQSSHLEDEVGRAPTKIPVALSLLYALLTFSVAAPGAIFLFNVLPCAKSSGQNSKGTWTTDMSLLPSAIQKWDKDHKDMVLFCTDDCTDANALFAVVGGTVYFRGSVEGSGSQVFAISNTSEVPEKVGDSKNPSWLTSVADEYACFLVGVDDQGHYGGYNGEDDFAAKHRIYCGNQDSGFENIELNKGVAPFNFLDYDGMLWFQQRYPVSGSGDFEMANGYAIVSMDPGIMAPIFHSVLVPAAEQQSTPNEEQPPEDGFKDDDGNFYVSDGENGNGADGCDPYITSKAQAIGVLLLSALPFVILSTRLWFKKGIPSSSISLFLALGLASMAVMALFDPYDGLMVGLSM
jgi:hypothetical protein